MQSAYINDCAKEDSNLKNTDLKLGVKSILLRHEGQAQAISGRELAAIFNLNDDRRVRLAIRDLISDGLPIAANTEVPAGYFIVATRQEAEQYAGSIRRRLIKDAIRRRDFRWAADQYLTPGEQGRLI